MKMKQKNFIEDALTLFMPNNTCTQATLSIELTVVYVEKEKRGLREGERKREGGKRERDTATEQVQIDLFGNVYKDIFFALI